MFDVVLGVKIVRTTEDTNIIGVVHMDSISETVRIASPIGIRSKLLKKRDHGESFKLEMYTLSEFSSTSIIINSSKWRDLQDPTASILSEYERICSDITSTVRDEYNEIDMDKIMDETPDDSTEGLRNIPKEISDEINNIFENIFNSKNETSNENKVKNTPKIRDRWVDKL